MNNEKKYFSFAFFGVKTGVFAEPQINSLWRKLIFALIFFTLFYFSFLFFGKLTISAKADFKRNSEIAKQKTVKLSKEVGSHISDASLTAAVKTNIMANEDISEFRRINVDTKQRIVYLKGEVPNEKAMIYANKKAKEVKGVRGVINMLKINP